MALSNASRSARALLVLALCSSSTCCCGVGGASTAGSPDVSSHHTHRTHTPPSSSPTATNRSIMLLAVDSTHAPLWQRAESWQHTSAAAAAADAPADAGVPSGTQRHGQASHTSSSFFTAAFSVCLLYWCRCVEDKAWGQLRGVASCWCEGHGQGISCVV